MMRRVAQQGDLHPVFMCTTVEACYEWWRVRTYVMKRHSKVAHTIDDCSRRARSFMNKKEKPAREISLRSAGQSVNGLCTMASTCFRYVRVAKSQSTFTFARYSREHAPLFPLDQCPPASALSDSSSGPRSPDI